jgi:glycosyltransferase involved in cell wall biosynthesis
MNAAMTSTLMITSNRFWLERGGSQRRIASLVRALTGAGSTVHVCFAGSLTPDDETAIRGITGAIGRIEAAPSPPGHTAQPDAPLASFACDAVRRRVHALIDKLRPDVALVQFIRLAYTVEGLGPEARARTVLAIDTHDVMHERCERFRALGQPHWVRLSRDEEAAALRGFDLVIAIQDRDAATLRAMLPEARIVVAAHAVEATAPRRARGVDRPITIGFLGVDSPPNRDAIGWFMDNCWPGLRERLGDGARLRIGGSVCDSCDVHEGVTLAGGVDELAGFYASIDIAINPVRIGGGLKIKNVEALAHGVPLVTTSVGSEGMEGAPADAMLIADDADAFIAHCVALCADPGLRARVGGAGQAYARARFSPRSAYAGLLDALIGAGAGAGAAA